jgi:hypothetical protein
MQISLTPAKFCCDVLVIGGGAAGTFAAISAAKTGAKTILIEKNGVLGGTMTCAGVNFPGLFFAWGKQIIAGPCWEAIKRTAELGGAELPKISYKPERHFREQIHLNTFIYSYVLDEAAQNAGVKTLFHTTLAALETSGNGYFAAVSMREGLCLIKAKRIIDASGDAAAVGMLKFPRLKSTSVQPATLIHNLTGYDPDTLNMEQFKEQVFNWFQEGKLNKEDFQGGNIVGSLLAKRIYMHLPAQDAETSEGRTALEKLARHNLMRIILCLRDFPGLENLNVSYCAQECGVRETYRIVGEKNITADEYVKGVCYEDAVCYSFYPIDRHIPEGIHQIFLEPETVPTIPYGALIPKGAEHILAAGRCIAGDADANSAYRIQATCMATGQVAGVAAAISAEKDISVKNVPIDELKSELNKQGAIVPTVK